MQNFDDSLLITGLQEPQQLLSSRSWSALRPGVDISYIYQTDKKGPSAAFLHYRPGASVPRHSHVDFEHILILHGSQTDGATHYPSGSLIVSKPGSQHQIRSAEGCIALAVWVKPVAFV